MVLWVQYFGGGLTFPLKADLDGGRGGFDLGFDLVSQKGQAVAGKAAGSGQSVAAAPLVH